MNNFEALASNPVLGGLIAATLYVATYLSFIRLLRFPRNWIQPSQKEVLTTGLLGITTIAWVSLSSIGPDLNYLLIATSFIVIMAFIIAAPALCFQPANKALEFLARHSEHAGLWLIGPALVVCLIIPGSKLQSMLLTAITIELLWLLRQYWEKRNKVIYPLTSSDCSVFKIHARGDLKEFCQNNGIKELIVSESDFSWRGCSKNTAPCPFNLYVNKLGLNTAPCCREHMRDISHYVSKCLLEIGAIHWLEGGSLLGAVREDGKLLEWEDDIDISVLLDEDITWDILSDQLAEKGKKDGYFVDTFEEKGLISVSFDAPKPWPFKWERNRLRGEIRVDIALYRRATNHGAVVLERQSPKGVMPATENGAYGVPLELVLPTSKIIFEGGNIACPHDSDAYLRLLYGNFQEIEYTYINPAAARNRLLATTVK